MNRIVHVLRCKLARIALRRDIAASLDWDEREAEAARLLKDWRPARHATLGYESRAIRSVRSDTIASW